jgi:hypothetical protein
MYLIIVGLPEGISAASIIGDLTTLGLCVLPVVLPFVAWALYRQITRRIG